MVLDGYMKIFDLLLAFWQPSLVLYSLPVRLICFKGANGQNARNSQHPMSLTRQLAFELNAETEALISPDNRLTTFMQNVLGNILTIIIFLAIIIFASIEIYFWVKTSQVQDELDSKLEKCNCTSLQDCPCEIWRSAQKSILRPQRTLMKRTDLHRHLHRSLNDIDYDRRQDWL